MITWQESADPSSQSESSNALYALQRVLKNAPQVLWLNTIRRTSIGIHDDLIFWMLNQTECDFAVAVSAFFRSDPAYYLDNPEPLPLLATSDPDCAFAQILINWDKGFYRTHNLELSTRDVHPREISRVKQKILAHPRGSLPFQIPARFLEPSGGEPTPLPEHLSPDNARNLWPIYAALKLHVPQTAPGLSRVFINARDRIQRLNTGLTRPS